MFFLLGFGFMLSSVGDCTVGARFGSRLYVIKIKKKKKNSFIDYSLKILSRKIEGLFQNLICFSKKCDKIMWLQSADDADFCMINLLPGLA